MVLQIEPFIIQSEMGQLSGLLWAGLAWRKGQEGAGWSEAGPGATPITSLDISGSNLGISPKTTEYEPGE